MRRRADADRTKCETKDNVAPNRRSSVQQVLPKVLSTSSSSRWEQPIGFHQRAQAWKRAPYPHSSLQTMVRLVPMPLKLTLLQGTLLPCILLIGPSLVHTRVEAEQTWMGCSSADLARTLRFTHASLPRSTLNPKK